MTAASGADRLRLGMIGGGPGAFIGGVHRAAARLDDQFTLVAGAFSSHSARNGEMAAILHLDPARCYDDFTLMARNEAARADGVDAVAIVTPNDLHCAIATAFLEAGIHVLCEKPMALNLTEAEQMTASAAASGSILALAHIYSGYPMVRHARDLVNAGALGQLRVIQVEYPQDWLALPIERSGNKQAGWRTNPTRAGAGGCIGDIGTHAFQLAEFVSGLCCQAVAAQLSTFVQGRLVDDDVQALLRFEGGVRGMLWSSQIAPGHANGLRLRIYGEKASLAWFQEQPDGLVFSPMGEAPRSVMRGMTGQGSGLQATRLPAGHPEGYFEAFAQLYRDFAAMIRAKQSGAPVAASANLLPLAETGVRGMRFIEAAVRSSRAGGEWRTI